MSILVIAEHDNKALNGATLNVVAAAQKIGGDITVLVAGSGAQAVADAAAKVAGVSKVLLADNAVYANQLAENVAALVADIAKGGFKHVLAASTTTGKNILPRVAALLDVSMITDIMLLNLQIRSSVQFTQATRLQQFSLMKQSLLVLYVVQHLTLSLLKVVLLRLKL